MASSLIYIITKYIQSETIASNYFQPYLYLIPLSLSSEFSDALQTIQRWSDDKNLSFLGLESSLEEQKSDSGSHSSNKMLPRDDILELERQRDGEVMRWNDRRLRPPTEGNGQRGRGGQRGGYYRRDIRREEGEDRDIFGGGGRGRGRGRPEANNAKNAWGEQSSDNSD